MNLFLNPLGGLLQKVRLRFFRAKRTKNMPIGPSVIPLPKQISTSTNKTELRNANIYFAWTEVRTQTTDTFSYLEKISGIVFEVCKEMSGAAIVIRQNIDLAPEEYSLQKVDEQIFIEASSPVGVLYGLYTLVKCFEKNSGQLLVPDELLIKDAPTSSWRGIHIDVSRNFFELEVLYDLVNLFSFYKLNKFHLHLTDDQGWRFESKKYPRLHTLGSRRSETVVGKHFPFFGMGYLGDKKVVAGYYSQDDLRALDQYALARGVEIIPEIDIPGHATAALVAYPQFAAYKAPKSVATYWGIFENVFSPSKEALEFLCDILGEVSKVFSSKYIHIGGDEVPAKNYKKDIIAQRLVACKEVESFEKIDTYILEHVAKHLVSINKIPVLWDEGREVALASGGVTMIWRDSKYAKEVLARGGRVVLCPSSHFYFDYYQKSPDTEPLAIGGYLPLEQVYSYKAPAPEGGEILGMQANLWTEYINTPNHLKYMLLPRLYALSEVAWGSNNNFADFKIRLPK